MKLIIKIVITTGLVLLIPNLISGIQIDGFITALCVAIVLGLLNIFIKPLFVVLTLPFTIVTLGLFLLVINALMIIICDNIVGGFSVDSFWTAILFSIILTVFQSISYRIIGGNK
jgi:putative membrane protein